MAPAGSRTGGPQPTIYDGAKARPADLGRRLVQAIPPGRVIGSNGAEYAKQSLALLARYQNPLTGEVRGFGPPIRADVAVLEFVLHRLRARLALY